MAKQKTPEPVTEQALGAAVGAAVSAETERCAEVAIEMGRRLGQAHIGQAIAVELRGKATKPGK